ncbi:MAG TPA: metallophosphoesterase [Vicinamibacterales bacterium]|jgi:Icc-related predicted phosphoesterase|nr:metallophosphoesterase [Vicinamibacterales bacterium]
MRIAATADLHVGKSSPGLLQPLLSQITTGADVLVLAGDITDYGTADEARNLVKDLAASVRIPIVAVLGNHDFEAGHEGEIQQILVDHGVCLLDGGTCEVQGVGFAGVKGFAGGFGRRALGPWGEPIIKQFVHEAVNEALKLESALARLRTDKKIVVMHYAPIQGTVEGEPCEIYPYLGSSRLEEPIGRYDVTAVLHGHAHNGQPEGRTSTGVPVYNVAYPLMRKLTPDQPFRILDV